MIKCRFPARDANAPFVTGLEAGKIKFRMRRDQVVPVQHREIEEFLRDFDAHRVLADVLRSSPTIPVAVKSGQRIAATAFQFGPENIRRHAFL